MECSKLQIASESVLPRCLDGFEEILWYLEQVLPYAPVFALELDGWIDPENWTEHLRVVQSRYPLLRARINKIPGKRPSFERTNDMDIPFRRVPLEMHDQVETAMERELAIGFGDGSGALARVSLLHAPDRAILLFAAHHAAFDGRTMMMILEDLLGTVSGKPLRAPFEEATSLSQSLSLPENCSYRTCLAETSHFARPDVKGIHVERVLLSEALTASVLSECKARAVNVRALMAAVIAEAGRESSAEWRSRPVNVTAPIDLRPMLDQGDTPGLLVGVISAAVAVSTSRSTFWETAASIGQAFQQTANVDAQRSMSLKIRQVIEDERPPLLFAEAWKNAAPSADIMINNYGRLAVQDDYGKFRIKTISSASLAGLGITQKVSMISLRGRIGICIATCRPIPGLIEKVSAILARACGVSIR
jgi:Condensation domain